MPVIVKFRESYVCTTLEFNIEFAIYIVCNVNQVNLTT